MALAPQLWGTVCLCAWEEEKSVPQALGEMSYHSSAREELITAKERGGIIHWLQDFPANW